MQLVQDGGAEEGEGDHVKVALATEAVGVQVGEAAAVLGRVHDVWCGLAGLEGSCEVLGLEGCDLGDDSVEADVGVSEEDDEEGVYTDDDDAELPEAGRGGR